MESQVMNELERASELVLAPPNIVTHEQRQAAENVILGFRKTKHPYSVCKYILENSKIDYVLFQSATTMRESVIREWSLLEAGDIESLRSFLLRYITQHISLQSYVREQILQTVAVILKRGTLDSKGASLDSLFSDVTQLINSGNVTMQLVACSMLTALLNEYSSSSRTSSVGFTWEFHIKCKHAFEVNDMKRVFMFSLGVLDEIEKQPSPLPRETTAVLNRFLGITEQVLCWEFTPKTNMRDQMLILLGKISCTINLSEMTAATRRREQKVRQHQRTCYWLEGKQICRSTFKFLHMISQDRLSHLLQHYKDNGLAPMEKKSGGRKSNTRSFEFEDTKRVVQFLTNYADENALVLPGRVPVFKRDDIKLIPSSHTKILVYTRYKEALEVSVRRHVGLFDINQNITLRPHEKWRDTLLDPTLIQLLFRIHKKARHNAEMAHHSIQCITQLASLNGPIFPDDKARTQYLTNYLGLFLEFLSSIDYQDHECLGIATTFKNLVMMFPSVCLSALRESLYNRFIEHLKRLTCAFGREAAMEEAGKEETLHMESYEKLLETWMELLTVKKDNIPAAVLKTHSVDVFTSYVQCHISPPDGCRVQNTLDSQLDVDDVDEIEEDDRDRFSDQLCSVGALARLSLENSVSMVTRALEDRVTRLHGQLQRIHNERTTSGGLNSSFGATLNSSFDQSLITVLHEDIHWLVLITAHLLTEESEGETPMIPADIMDYSIEQSSHIDLNTTLKVLSSPSDNVNTIPGASTHADHVIRLISAVFRLCEVEKQAASAKMVDALSPQVTSSTMWLLRRWSRSYLLPDENYYSQVSKALWSAFGRDSEGAQWTVAFLLDKIMSALSVWGSEAATLTDTLQLLVTLVDNKSRAAFITKCEGLWTIVRQLSQGEAPFVHLPGSSKRLLYKALVKAGPGIVDADMQADYWQLVLQSLQKRFYDTVCAESFTKDCHSVMVKDAVINLLESICGIAEGSRVDTLDRLFDYLHPLMLHCVTLLDLYHNYEDVVPLILETFSEVVQKHLCFLGEEKSKLLYEVCLSAIQTYSKHNTGKRIENASEEEEERYNDILLVMELLTNLLSKDFVDFSDTENEPSSTGEQITAADVVLFGLNTIIPLMTEDILRFPSLCSQYFKLITFLAEIHPNKFTSLPADLFKNLMLSLEMGLNAYGLDTSKLCLESICSLATHVFQSNLAGSQMHTMLQHFLKLVFRMLLLETFNLDLLDTASSTLFALICCHQEQYRELVNEILLSQGDEVYKHRLLEAFNNLTPPSLDMTISRHSKIKFMQNFNQFLINVRGFLCVK